MFSVPPSSGIEHPLGARGCSEDSPAWPGWPCALLACQGCWAAGGDRVQAGSLLREGGISGTEKGRLTLILVSHMLYSWF